MEIGKLLAIAPLLLLMSCAGTIEGLSQDAGDKDAGGDAGGGDQGTSSITATQMGMLDFKED